MGGRWFVIECAILLSGRKMVVRTGERPTGSSGDAYQVWLCSSNNASTARGASTGLELNREILLLAGGGGLGGGEEGEEGIHFS